MQKTKSNITIIICLCSVCLLIVLYARFNQHNNSVANIFEKLSHSTKDENNDGDIRTQFEIEEEGKWRLSPIKTNRPSVLNRKELLLLAEAKLDQLKDFQVTFQTVEEKPIVNKVTRSRVTLVLKGPRIYIDNYYSFDPNAPQFQFRRVVAFNGKKTTLYEAHRALASVAIEQSREVDTQKHEFFNLNLLNAPGYDRSGSGLINTTIALASRFMNYGGGRDDQSLISLLRGSRTTVRPFLEKIGAHSCHVIDSDNFSVWLDAKRGCVPLRQVFKDSRNPNRIQMKYLVRRVAEVSPGFWLATRGRKVVGNSEVIIMVEGWFANKPAIKINAGVVDTFFDLWKHLPPGTEVWDRETNKTAISFVDQNSVSN